MGMKALIQDIKPDWSIWVLCIEYMPVLVAKWAKHHY